VKENGKIFLEYFIFEMKSSKNKLNIGRRMC
jgi:hypothetical protein